MVDVVIVNWNSGDYLQLCLESIFSLHNRKLLGKLIITDNASADDSLNRIATTDEMVIIKNTENYGFARACNQGFIISSSPYVLLLNPDARLMNDTLSECVRFMENDKGVDILGCQLLDDKGAITPSCSRFPTPLRFFFQSVGLSTLAPKAFTPPILMTDWDHKSSRQVDQVMGAFMFIRKNVFDKIGYFDERFFVYYEELDFSKRLYEAGGKSYFNSDIKAIHSGEGTTKKVKGYRLFLNLNSRLIYTKKHLGFTSYLFVKFCTFLIEPFTRSTLLLLRGQAKQIRDVWKGYSLFFKRGNSKSTTSK